MDKSGKYDTIKIVGSAIVSGIGLLLVLAKIYDYIGIILLSFGSIILAFSLETKRKGIISDELTEWISGKSANLSFTVTWSTIVLLLAVDIYKPGFLETYIALSIMILAMVGARLAGMYYYEKISKNIGF